MSYDFQDGFEATRVAQQKNIWLCNKKFGFREVRTATGLSLRHRAQLVNRLCGKIPNLFFEFPTENLHAAQ